MHDGGVPINGINALIKEMAESSFAPSAMRDYSKKTSVCEPGRVSSPGTESASDLILNFRDARTMRNKFVVNKPYSLFCYRTPNGLRQLL